MLTNNLVSDVELIGHGICEDGCNPGAGCWDIISRSIHLETGCIQGRVSGNNEYSLCLLNLRVLQIKPAPERKISRVFSELSMDINKTPRCREFMVNLSIEQLDIYWLFSMPLQGEGCLKSGSLNVVPSPVGLFEYLSEISSCPHG
jgi:hypothetical protein